MIKRHALAFLVSLLILCQAMPVFGADASYRVGPEIYGEAYCVMDAETGDVICGRDAMGKYYPASITKILTALVVLEETENLYDELEFSAEALAPINSSSSTMPPVAKVGERMTVWDALCGLFLSSANECGNALAEYVAGGTPEFAELMNAKAAEIGAVNSHFTNAHGLHNRKHYTNSYDMCLIMREALQNETFRRLASLKTYTIPATNKTGARPLAMGHQMVVGNIPYEGVYAGKTGRTPYAGRTLVTAAEYHGRSVIITLMKSTDQYHYIDAEILLDYVYSVIDGAEEWNFKECGKNVTATANVNLRGKATDLAEVRGSIPKGDAAVCLGDYAGWCKVEFKGRIYYAVAEYLEHEEAETQEETTSHETVSETEPSSAASEGTLPVETEENTSSEAEKDTTEAVMETEEDVPDKKDGTSKGSQILLIVGLFTVGVAVGVGGFFFCRRKEYRRRRFRRKFRDWRNKR